MGSEAITVPVSQCFPDDAGIKRMPASIPGGGNLLWKIERSGHHPLFIKEVVGGEEIVTWFYFPRMILRFC